MRSTSLGCAELYQNMLCDPVAYINEQVMFFFQEIKQNLMNYDALRKDIAEDKATLRGSF